MGSSKAKYPAPPDPNKVADAQNAQNLYASAVNLASNRIGQKTPYGSVNYENNGYWRVDDNGQMTQTDKAGNDGAAYIPNQTQNTVLSKNQQALLDAQEKGDIANTQLSNTMLGDIKTNYGKNPDEIFNNAPKRVNDITGSLVKPQTGYDYKDLSTANLPNMPQSEKMQFNYGNGSFSEDRKRVEDAIMARQNPELERQRAGLEQRLADQGITAGSEAYNNAMDGYGRQVNDARTQAILSGGDEQSRMFGLASNAFNNNLQAQEQAFNQGMAGRQQGFNENTATTDSYNSNRANQATFNNRALLETLQAKIQAGNFDNTNRQNAISEGMTRRNLPLNEFNSLRTGNPVQTPSFTPFYQTSVAPSDITNPTYNSYQQQIANISANNAAKNQQMQGMMNAGIGVAALASDIRLKTDIVPIGTTAGGHNLYKFRYKNNPDAVHIGVMAQEAQKITPSAVHEIDGFLHVDYSQID
jgi:Chaperone of endosialidase